MKRNQRGVTLIELMIVVVIVGILAAIAIPGYRQYVIRANRASGKIQLTQTAQSLERCYTNSSPYAYDSATCAAGVPLPVMTPDGTYRVSGVMTPTTYTLTATPQGSQTADTRCGNFVLTQAGTRTISGTLTVAECWGK
jgi:type IV pilus assembly protein PilE